MQRFWYLPIILVLATLTAALVAIYDVAQPLDMVNELVAITAICCIVVKLRLQNGNWHGIQGWLLMLVGGTIDYLDEFDGFGKVLVEIGQFEEVFLVGGFLWVCWDYLRNLAQKQRLIGELSAEVQRRTHAEQQLIVAAEQDPLTQLGNRRRFNRCYFEWVQQAQSPHLIYIDLDRFKQVNDNFGHHIGDEVLQLVASSMLRLTNPTQCQCYRFGGDEFLVLYDGDDIELWISDLRLALGQAKKEYGFGLSCGHLPIAPHTPLEQLLHQADQLMYSDKATRR